MTLFVTILQLLCGLAVILAVLFQSGKSAGLSGTIGGVADTFMAKGKAKTFDAKLAKATKWIGAVFIALLNKVYRADPGAERAALIAEKDPRRGARRSGRLSLCSPLEFPPFLFWPLYAIILPDSTDRERRNRYGHRRTETQN